MPAKNSRKIYSDNQIYHVYNRGVEKRKIFEEEIDYKVFLKYLKEYLSLPSKDNQKVNFLIRNQSYVGVSRQTKNYNGQLELLAYCLMPNHFHLLVKTMNGDSLKTFMQSLQTRYSMYFNKKFKRVGSLFQGRYKAINVTDDSYLLHLSRYIHLNPLEHTNNLVNAYSSYADYLGLRNTEWINCRIVLSSFDNKVLPDFVKINSYRDFVEKYPVDSKTIIEQIIIED